MNTDDNVKIALYFGFQMTTLGWFDNNEVLQLPYTTDNTFDKLLFDVSFDWLIPIVEELFQDENFTDDYEIQHSMKINDALLTLNIREIYDIVIDFINKYPKQ